MSRETLKADVRYQDCIRALDRTSRDLDLNNPAFGSVVTQREGIFAQMGALAVEHGWNVEREEWDR